MEKFELLKPLDKREYDRFSPSIKKFLEEIEKENGDLSKIGLKKLITPPNGYAKAIIDEKKNKLTNVQLRKIFYEFKQIYEKHYRYSKNQEELNKKKEEIFISLYKLYPIINYQHERGLIDQDIKFLFWNLIKIIEYKLENFELVNEFVTALIAYAPKS